MSMFGARPAVDAGAEPPAKKMAVGSGGGSGGCGVGGGEEKDPIPRPLRQNQITITLRQRSWEEISSMAIYYIPLCYHWSALLDDENINQITRWYSKCRKYEVHAPKFRCTNFLILNDALGTGANPTEITSFIQRAKIVHFTPSYSHSRRFLLYNGSTLSPETLVTFQDDTWQVKDPGTTQGNFGLATVPGSNGKGGAGRSYVLRSAIDTDFEDLKMIVGGGQVSNPAEGAQYNSANIGQFDIAAGLNATGSATPYTEVQGCYERTDPSWSTRSGEVSGGILRNDPEQDQFLKSVKNTTAFKIIGGDDTIEETVVHNMPSSIERKIIGHSTDPSPEATYNNFFCSGNLPLTMRNTTTTIIKYQPVYPNIYNPCIPKMTWNSPQHVAWLSQMKPLRHHFLTMIPIIQNAAVVNQRANFLFEQECSMTFHFDEGWSDMEMDLFHGADIRMMQKSDTTSASYIHDYKMFIT